MGGGLVRRGVVLLVSVLFLAGCTADEDGGGERSAGPSSSEGSAGTGGELTPDQVAARLLEDVPSESADPIASASGTIGLNPPVQGMPTTTLTLDVVSLRRDAGVTRAVMRISTEAPRAYLVRQLGPSPTGYGTFLLGLFLDDAASGTRYVPLLYDQAEGMTACMCPQVSMFAGPQPQTVTAVFPELDEEIDTITMTVGTSLSESEPIVIADIPVSD